MLTDARSRRWLRAFALAALFLLAPVGPPAAADHADTSRHATVVAAGLASELAAVPAPPTQPAGAHRGPHAVQSTLPAPADAPLVGWTRQSPAPSGPAAVATRTVQERAPPEVAR